MRRPATMLFAFCCTCLIAFGCSGPQSNVTAPGTPGLHAPEGVLVGGTEVADTGEASDEVESPGAATESKEASASRREQGSECGPAIAMHTIEVATKSKLKKDEQFSIPIAVKGGSGQFKWYAISYSTLPAGMYFNGEGRGERSAVIAGAPLQSGTYQPVIKVRDETCKRDAEKQITIEVMQVGEATPSGPPTAGIEAVPTVPSVRLIYNTLGSDPQELFLFEDEPKDAPNFRDFIKLIVQPAGKTGNDQPIPEDRYKIVFRYQHFYQKPDGSTDWNGCTRPYASQHPECYHEMENGVLRDARAVPRVDETTEHEFVVTDTQDGNKEYRYTVYGKKGCKTLNLSDAHLLLKMVYAKTSDSGYCYSGGDRYVTQAGVGLGNAHHRCWVTDDLDQWFRGGMYRTSYKLTSEANDNQIKENPKFVTWGPADRLIPSTYVDARCLEEIDDFCLWFKESGCTGTPDFRVSAIEVKACPDDDDLRREGGENCYYASYYKKDDYIGWNSISNYGECMGNFAFDRIPGTNMETWSRERDMQIVDLFNALGIDY